MFDTLLLFLCAVYGITQAGFVDTLYKCRLRDNNCLKNVMLQKLSNPGQAEFNLLPFEPVEIKGVSMTVRDLVNVTVLDGVMTGMKDCDFKSFAIDLKTGTGKEEITCDIIVKGLYKAKAAKSVLKAIQSNDDLHGVGIGEIKIHKLNIKMQLPLHFEKRGDDIFIVLETDKLQHESSVLGKAEFTANKLFAGEKNIAPAITKYMNENWKVVMKSIQKDFVNEFLKIYFDYSKYFLEGVPTKYYIKDDLTPYL